jgi:hypothetical protein
LSSFAVFERVFLLGIAQEKLIPTATAAGNARLTLKAVLPALIGFAATLFAHDISAIDSIVAIFLFLAGTATYARDENENEHHFNDVANERIHR